MTQKILLSERALCSRLSRKLKENGILLKKCKENNKFYSDLGRYYTVNTRTNSIEAMDINLLEWAKKLKIIKEWEDLAESSSENSDINHIKDLSNGTPS